MGRLEIECPTLPALVYQFVIDPLVAVIVPSCQAFVVLKCACHPNGGIPVASILSEAIELAPSALKIFKLSVCVLIGSLLSIKTAWGQG